RGSGPDGLVASAARQRLRGVPRLALLVSRVLWAATRHRRRHPLVSASLRGALRYVLPRLRTGGLEGSLFVTRRQVDSFIEHGWDYTERRLELLRAVVPFPFDHEGARQLWQLRRGMESVRGGTFEDVEASVYGDPLYAVFQHIGQAFRNEVSGRYPFTLDTLASLGRSPARVCDVGCGSGILLGDVLEACPDARGHGVDVSPVMLLHASRVMHARRLAGRTAFIAGDIRRLPFPADSFDFLIANEVLEHLPEPVLGIRELQRVLRPGACLASSIPVGDDVPTHLSLFGSEDQVLDLYRKGGLEVVDYRTIEVAPGIPDVMVAARKRD
ncbi:MAG: class I SAM-dependent methyltransferase, partial [Longimicrobiales bacterium]